MINAEECSPFRNQFYYFIFDLRIRLNTENYHKMFVSTICVSVCVMRVCWLLEHLLHSRFDLSLYIIIDRLFIGNIR